MKRLSLIVTLPLVLILIVFAVANRQAVELNLWPFATITTWLFLVALGMLVVGMLIGALWMWLPLLHWRLRGRSQERRIVELEAALAENRAIVAQLREAPHSSAMLAPPPG
jgi:putative membrane protein